MTRNRLLRSGFLLAAACLLAVIFFEVWERETDSTVPSKDYPRFARCHSTGIVHSHVEDGKALFTIRADEITHRKRKLGPFTINPLKEIVMVNVPVEVDAEALWERIGEQRENTDAFQTLSAELTKQANLKGLGFISNVLIKGIEFALVRDG